MTDIRNKSGDIPTIGHRIGAGARRFTPGEKPKNVKGVLRRLLGLMLPFRKSLAVTVLLTIISSGLAVVGPLLLGRAINTLDTQHLNVDTRLLMVILISLAACYVAGWIIDTTGGVLMARVTQRFVKDIRRQFYAKLQHLPLQFYDTRSHGDTMSRITNDVDNISGTISQATTQLVASVFTISGTFVMMLVLSPTLTAVAMVSILLFSLLSKTITTRSRKFFLAQQRKLGLLNAMVEESVIGLKMVKAFHRQQQLAERFATLNGELCENATQAQTWAGFYDAFHECDQ